MPRVSIWVFHLEEGNHNATLTGEPLLDYKVGIADGAGFRSRLFAVSLPGTSDLAAREVDCNKMAS
ncbi:MAG: hypothetical protein VXZ82_04380 [Planctomycetota bacterium]|nr:hypothetical protein [Planctomycetota bacterium]